MIQQLHRIRSTAGELADRLSRGIGAAVRAVRSKTTVEREPLVIQARPSTKAPAPSLRPPTLMIDLLFGTLMLFAFQMGDPSAQRIVSHEFELPTSDRKAADERVSLLALKPLKGVGAAWSYELPDGRRLAPDDIRVIVKKRNKTPVLLVPSGAPIQDYLDAEQPLRQRGLKVGLAVATEGSRP